MTKNGSLIFAAASLVAASLLPCTAARADEPPPRAPWDAETVRVFESLPVQDGGRVKPLGTLAGFKLLKLCGKRSCATPAGEDLTPVPWLLDAIFSPELAVTYPTFLVQNSEVIDAIGLDRGEKKKRDRYSYAELAPAFEHLRELAVKYDATDEKDRTPVEAQIVQLWSNIIELDRLIHLLDFAKEKLPVDASEGLRSVFAGVAAPGLPDVLARARVLLALHGEAGSRGRTDETDAVQRLLDASRALSQRSSALALFPPAAPVAEQAEWLSAADLFELAFARSTPPGEPVRLLALLGELDRAKADRPAFLAKLHAFHDGVVALARERGEYAKVPVEVAFYKGDFFYRALLLYVLAFVLLALSWLVPRKLLDRASLASLAAATVLVLAGMTLRCVIRGRPPVSTLYETIIFTTAVAVLACFVIEYLDRQRIASAVATVLGTGGMFLAAKYEFRESITAGDTMPSLVAVLDTNFWLSLHVTTVTMGYSAGLLASAIAHVWLVGRIVGLRADDAAFYKNVSRMTYGVLCFGLLFSIAGTMLGGIWANESWGRFWGWDPKENGALMICLWELAILHARLGGYVRDFGVAMLSVVGGCVVAFSWWGVNLLGVGLHSYGFTSGVFGALVGLLAVEGVVLLLAAGWWLAQRKGALAALGTGSIDSVAAASDGRALEQLGDQDR